MEVCSCFWATLMFVTLVAATSSITCTNDQLIVRDKELKNLGDHNCSEKYRNLTIIQLSNNNLSSLKGTGLSDVRGLIYLTVVHNQLTSLDPDLLSNLTELVYLDLSYNKLESFSNEQIFSSQNKLQALILSNNQIVTLNLRVLAPLHALTELNLTSNPFVCDCELRHTVKWCAERKLTTGGTCMNGVLWTDFSYENCTSVMFIVIGIAIGIAVSVCVAVVVWMRFLRRARHVTFGTENASPEQQLENLSFNDYETIPSSQGTRQSLRSAVTFLFKPVDISSSPEYTQIIQIQPVHHKENVSKPDIDAGMTSLPTYSEPYQQITDSSGTYAVPYYHTTVGTGRSKSWEENVSHAESSDEIHPAEISVRNSLYSEN